MTSIRRIGTGQDALVVYSVVPYHGRARELIKELKYDGRLEHAGYLGHLLFRQLDRRWERQELDLVVANPTHTHRGVRHTELLIGAMAQADTQQRWAFDDPASPCLLKQRPTVAAHGRDMDGRRHVADAVKNSLVVPRRDMIEGRRILVVDDVVTTGSQMQAVASVLRESGAASVQGLVVASADTPAAARSAESPGSRSARALGRLDGLGHCPSGGDGLSV